MKFQFDNYNITEIIFDKNNDFISSEAVNISPTFEIQIAINDEGDDAIVSLGVIIFEDYKKNNEPFRLSVKISGYFNFTDFSDREEVFKFCKLNGIATLYPYLRSVVSSIVTTTNHNNLVLPLLNVVELTKDLKYNDIKMSNSEITIE